MNLLELLPQSEPFSHFAPALLERLTPSVIRVHFPADAPVLRQGELTHEAYFILRGEVRIQRDTPYGVFSLGILGAGNLFGETAFIDRLRRSGDAVATVDTELLAFSPVALNALMAEDQRLTVALYWAFWKSLSTKLRKTNEKLTEFFSESGRPPTVEPSLAARASPEFRLDLDAKRKLFEEQRLSSLEINFLSSLSREIKLGPGEVLFREGEPGDRMYVVLDGRVMISKYIPGAGEEALAFLERGDYFGEMALIDKQPRSAAASAYDRGAVVLAIPSDVLEGILDMQRLSSPRLLKILCSLVAHRLRELDDKLAGWFILAGGHGDPVDSPPGLPDPTGP